VIDVTLHGVLLHVTVENATIQQTLEDALASAGITVGQVETVLPSLEDVFVSLVAREAA